MPVVFAPLSAGSGALGALPLLRLEQAGPVLHIRLNRPAKRNAITQALPRIADLSASDGLFMETLMSSIAQGDEAAKERVRAFLDKRAGKVGKA